MLGVKQYHVLHNDDLPTQGNKQNGLEILRTYIVAPVKNVLLTELDILKSIVYGGLIESITSFGVVSSAAGSGTSTGNVHMNTQTLTRIFSVHISFKVILSFVFACSQRSGFRACQFIQWLFSHHLQRESFCSLSFFSSKNIFVRE